MSFGLVEPEAKGYYLYDFFFTCKKNGHKDSLDRIRDIADTLGIIKCILKIQARVSGVYFFSILRGNRF